MKKHHASGFRILSLDRSPRMGNWRSHACFAVQLVRHPFVMRIISHDSWVAAGPLREKGTDSSTAGGMMAFAV